LPDRAATERLTDQYPQHVRRFIVGRGRAMGSIRSSFARPLLRQRAIDGQHLAACRSANSAAPSPAMPKDELRRLPEHVTAALLRALLCIPRAPQSRLVLQPVEERRAPFYTVENDFRVLYRGRSVGRIDREPDDRCDYPHAPWRWFLNHEERKRMASGRAATREEAMSAFRKAWDETPFGVVAGKVS